MTLPVIVPVHRPDVPADLRDDVQVVGHLDDAGLLVDLGATSMHDLAEHYRNRLRQAASQDLCGRLLDTEPLPDDQELEETTRNVLTLRAHMHVKHDYGPRIDWTTILDDDIESNVSINQHCHIAALSLAYRRTGQQRYSDHAVAMLRSWFEQSPAPSEQAWLQWRTLEVGGRLTFAWPIIGVCLCDSPSLTDQDLVDLVRWTWLSVRYLRRFIGPPNNWMQIESAGALCALAFLGNIPAGRGWTDLFERRLEWINRRQFLPDGMQAENSPVYHVFPWWRLYMAGVWTELFGGSLPADYWREQLLRTKPLWMLRQPDGFLPTLSDCSPQPVCIDPQLDFVRRHQPQADLPDPVRLAGEGQLPEHHRVCHLPYAGYTACRTGWEPGAEFLLFDHGFYGTSHQHEDKLTFLYGAGGRILMGDGGIYRYTFDAWEHYWRGGASHNVVMVDGRQQCRSLRAWQGKCEATPDPDCRYAVHPDGAVVLSGWYRDGFAPRLHWLWARDADRSDELAGLDETIQHQRLLVWLPGRGVLVLDRLTGQGEHQVDRVFHVAPFETGCGREQQFLPGRMVIGGNWACQPAEGNLPGVLLVAGDSGCSWSDYCGSKEPLRGWTTIYEVQPSHDLWRSGRLNLPVTTATWIEPWRDARPPRQVGLSLRQVGDAVEFTVQTDSSKGLHGTTNFADLGLEISR